MPTFSVFTTTTAVRCWIGRLRRSSQWTHSGWCKKVSNLRLWC